MAKPNYVILPDGGIAFVNGNGGGGTSIAGGAGITVYGGTVSLDSRYFEVVNETVFLHNFSVLGDNFTVAGGGKLIFDGAGVEFIEGTDMEYFGYGDIQRKLVAGENITLDGNTISASGGGSSETPVVTLVGTAIPQAGKVYLYTPTAGDVITFFTPTAGVDNSFELDVVQGETAASFTLPTVTWVYGTPDLSAANKTTRILFRYASGEWQAWSTPEMSEYLRKIDVIEKDGLNITMSNGGMRILTSSSAYGTKLSIADTQLQFDASDTLKINANGRIELNTGLIMRINHAQNTPGGFVISDTTTGAITSPGDVVATIGGTTHSMSELLSRIEALENA